jgi:hypothetical protein
MLENTQDDLAELLGAIAAEPDARGLQCGCGRGSGFVSQKRVAAGSQRFVFAGFRRRTPGPPPLMNSTPTASKVRRIA